MKKKPTKKKATKKKTAKEEKVYHAMINNCDFTGGNVVFDKETVNTMETIAEGLLENAKSLGLLANVFRVQNITMGTLLSVGPNTEDKTK